MASLIQRPNSSLYYIQHMVSGKPKRFSTGTDSLKVAEEKLRQFESAVYRGTESLLPTKTLTTYILSQYVEHIRSAKTEKSAQTDIYYLRDAFGPVCDELKVTIARLVEQFGDRVYADLPKLFSTGTFKPPILPANSDAWTKWILEIYAPMEPRGFLSPGVMSNPPDRFDGFHSFNRCCRESSDPGRSKENLQSYSTDRRVFEYWVDGDWVAADHLMGLIRSDKTLKAVACVIELSDVARGLSKRIDLFSFDRNRDPIFDGGFLNRTSCVTDCR